MNAINICGEKVYPGQEISISNNIARLPSHTSIDIPILISRSEKPGPTLLLMGGLHGDEINGIEIVHRIIEKGYHKPEAGTCICIPILNIYGFINFSREVPDGKDVNRSFPGTKDGSLAGRVAYFLMKQVIPHIDYGIDFHTGGAARGNFPQIRAQLNSLNNKELAEAFNAPITLNAAYRPKSLRQSAAKLKKPILVYEGGESLRFDELAIQIGIEGTLRVMKHLGMRLNAPSAKYENIEIRKNSWVRAKNAGLFHPAVTSGSIVKKRNILGTITDPFGEFKVKVQAPYDAMIIGMNNQAVVNQGDALMHLGRI